MVLMQIASKRPPSIFLSHNSKDKFFVRRLAEELKKFNVKVWLDEAEIKIGDSLTDRISKAINQTDYFAVVLSHSSVNSEWVQRELQIAIQKEIIGRRVVVLPLLLESVEIPGFLKDKLYADFTSPEKFQSSFGSLLKSLGLAATIKLESQGSIAKPPSPPPQPPPKILVGGLNEFEDITIVDLDEKKTYKPDPRKALFNVYLKLSSRPPEEWQGIFDAERQFPRHTMWRRAWVEGEYILVYCVPDEVEKYHFNDLKKDVANSNTKYRQYLTEQDQRRAREDQKKKQEADQIKSLKGRLKF